MKNPVADQARADIGGLEQVIQLEKAADGEQRHQAPNSGDGGQAVDAGADVGGSVGGEGVRS